MKKNRFPKISNEELNLEKIPNPDDKSSDYQETWEKFALTMNAYEVCGDSETAFVTGAFGSTKDIWKQAIEILDIQNTEGKTHTK